MICLHLPLFHFNREKGNYNKLKTINSVPHFLLATSTWTSFSHEAQNMPNQGKYMQYANMGLLTPTSL